MVVFTAQCSLSSVKFLGFHWRAGTLCLCSVWYEVERTKPMFCRVTNSRKKKKRHWHDHKGSESWRKAGMLWNVTRVQGNVCVCGIKDVYVISHLHSSCTSLIMNWNDRVFTSIFCSVCSRLLPSDRNIAKSQRGERGWIKQPASTLLPLCSAKAVESKRGWCRLVFAARSDFKTHRCLNNSLLCSYTISWKVKSVLSCDNGSLMMLSSDIAGAAQSDGGEDGTPCGCYSALSIWAETKKATRRETERCGEDKAEMETGRQAEGNSSERKALETLRYEKHHVSFTCVYVSNL